MYRLIAAGGTELEAGDGDVTVTGGLLELQPAGGAALRVPAAAIASVAEPEPYIVREYERAKNHKWYMTSRMICVNDIYSFDPNAKVDLDDFVDIIGRNFKQPEEGLGFDSSPSSHMWRTLMWPTRYL